MEAVFRNKAAARQALQIRVADLKPLVRPTLAFGISLFALTIMMKSVVRDKAKTGSK